MDKRTILTRYAKYCETLEILGKIPLCSQASIDDLKPSRGLMQSCYKEIKELNFQGTLIDYLCWISTLYLIDRAGSEDVVQYVKKNYPSIMEDANNLLRLFNKKPEFFLNEINSMDSIETYEVMSIMWFTAYRDHLKFVNSIS